MATPCSILAWRNPWTEEPGELQLIGHKESDMTETPSRQTRNANSDQSFGSYIRDLALSSLER